MRGIGGCCPHHRTAAALALSGAAAHRVGCCIRFRVLSVVAVCREVGSTEPPCEPQRASEGRVPARGHCGRCCAPVTGRLHLSPIGFVGPSGRLSLPGLPQCYRQTAPGPLKINSNINILELLVLRLGVPNSIPNCAAAQKICSDHGATSVVRAKIHDDTLYNN